MMPIPPLIQHNSRITSPLITSLLFSKTNYTSSLCHSTSYLAILQILFIATADCYLTTGPCGGRPAQTPNVMLISGTNFTVSWRITGPRMPSLLSSLLLSLFLCLFPSLLYLFLYLFNVMHIKRRKPMKHVCLLFLFLFLFTVSILLSFSSSFNSLDST